MRCKCIEHVDCSSVVGERYIKEEYNEYKKLKESAGEGAVVVPLGDETQLSVVEAVDRSLMGESCAGLGGEARGKIVGAVSSDGVPSSRSVRVGDAMVVPTAKSSDQGHVMWVRRVHPDARLPTRGTEYAAAMDLYACEDGCVPVKGKVKVKKTALLFRLLCRRTTSV